MPERPEHCEKANCPYFRYLCHTDEQVKRMYPSAKGRAKERERLSDLAKKDPAELIRRCATTGDIMIYRK